MVNMKKEGVKTTYITYCQVCSKDFKDGEIAYFAPVDNNIICKECSMIHKSKQERKVVK